ncbi:MAG: hypothetical protein JRE28_00010 [Deltaproteobacteria bacterium]|nr:hypothetical protein [Deltaproteobacteria bacterium]
MEIEKLLDEETKICPKCAETIKFKAKICRYCQTQFDPDEVDKQIKAHRDELTKKMEGKVRCPKCGNWDTYVALLKDGTYGNYCSHCKEPINEMSTTSEKPPKPSTEKDSSKPKKSGCGMGCGGILLVLFILFIIGSIMNSLEDKTSGKKSTAPTTSWREQDRSSMAYIMMEDYVKTRLKSPKSAEFPGVFDGKLDHVSYLGNQKYRINSWVDAQNAFGATIRTRFVGEIEQVSIDQWRLVSLRLLE